MCSLPPPKKQNKTENSPKQRAIPPTRFFSLTTIRVFDDDAYTLGCGWALPKAHIRTYVVKCIQTLGKNPTPYFSA